MVTTEELIARIEHLEKIVYDELEYPSIVRARQKDFQKRDYERRGIKVLTKPQPEPLIDFSFHSRFTAELIYNDMHVTFRRNRQGETGSVFVIRQGLDFRVNPPAKFTITDIERINLKTFISMFWLDAGFNTLDDACRYYAATYADELGETSAPDFEKINGWIYKFRRLDDE